MNLKEDIKSLAFAVVIVLSFHSFLFKPFNIPSESMVPTLLIGDYLFVSKFTYGYSKNSFPFSPPIFKGRVFYTPPQMGDVAVFRKEFPNDPKRDSEDWVKRVVGLPGDKIQMKGGQLFINGKKTELEKVGTYTWKDQKAREQVSTHYIETLPNGVKHSILKSSDFGDGDLDNTEEYTVPEGHFYMMGDNRDHSGDSRVHGAFSEESLIGQVKILFFSTGIPTTPGGAWWQIWKWPTETRYSRFFNIIK